jgi:hypothetical protein
MADFTLGPVVANPFGEAGPAPAPEVPAPKGYTLGPVETDPFREPSASEDVVSGLVTGGLSKFAGAPVDIVQGLKTALPGMARSTASDITHPLDTLAGMVPYFGEKLNPGAAERTFARQKEISERTAKEAAAETPPIGGSQWIKSGCI